jgi:hypothetical protein
MLLGIIRTVQRVPIYWRDLHAWQRILARSGAPLGMPAGIMRSRVHHWVLLVLANQEGREFQLALELHIWIVILLVFGGEF